ncbi:uncharacterized protein C8R40DRAFT_1167312 [Lentinula edodes]|uniref:uncharacterized protein n=1 Tax=Lentinula edodes TaxID=5353 RepID=UPI001E8CC6A1|nr:uncharacterized protein C8R40DRAFT_1167312 [Lentinula edodes]KAH7878583.1 hypothetical protein C8R40DRAFT_1167312 [Lentinula edodes]
MTSHSEYTKTEQVVGRPRTTSHNRMDDYVKNPPDAIRDSEAYEDRLNNDKHERQYRAETKKHTGGRLGALGDAEEGGIPQVQDRQDREVSGMVDRAGVVIHNEKELALRRDFE